MDQYFKSVADIIEKNKISSRVRFMLQNVIEMRKVTFEMIETFYLCIV